MTSVTGLRVEPERTSSCSGQGGVPLSVPVDKKIPGHPEENAGSVPARVPVDPVGTGTNVPLATSGLDRA